MARTIASLPARSRITDYISRNASAFPKIRFVVLLENGTHVLWAARMSQYATDEMTLAQKVVPALRKGMLCVADRFFPVARSGGRPSRRERICSGESVRMPAWRWSGDWRTAPI